MHYNLCIFDFNESYNLYMIENNLLVHFYCFNIR